MSVTRLAALATAFVAVALPTRDILAQGAASYADSALAITPAWNGLAVVRGTARVRAANLNFFLPSDITAAFAGDSAVSIARRAMKRRRVAAMFTDIGLTIGAIGLAAGLIDNTHRKPAQFAATFGAILFAISVPMQFSADDALGRAVWWHNARFAR